MHNPEAAQNPTESGAAGTQRLTGVFFVLVSVALFSMTTMLAKLDSTGQYGQHLHPVQLASGRFFFAFCVIFLICFLRPVNFVGVPWLLHLKRSVCGWLGICLLFTAATRMPLADANAISFLSGIITMALSIVLLGERVGLRRWSAAGLALLGGLIVIRPGTSTFDPAAIFALMAAVAIGMETVFIKKLSGIEPPLRILFANNMFGSLVSLCILPFFWSAPAQGQWLILFGIGSIMAMGQFFNILAMQRGDASFIAPFWFSVPLFAAFYDYLVFGVLITPLSGVGILLIICGGILITLREQQLRTTRAAIQPPVP